MATIPADVILIWSGSNATIPSGWSRETTLDSKFPKAWGDAVAPNETGGATTHLHSISTHSHSLTTHTHTYTLTQATGGTDDDNRISGTTTPQIISYSHNHTGTTGNNTASTSGTSSATNTGTASNDPPNRAVIFIKAAAGAQLATNIVALYNSNTPPSNWSNVTELSGRYMKGAGTGADADLSTDSGSSTNTHDLTHSHSAASHDHGTADSGTSANYSSVPKKASSWALCYTHVHSVTPGSTSVSVTNYTSSQALSGTIEPAYAILQAIKKGASGIKAVGIIGLWLGSTASIPDGWVLCDGNNSTKDLRDKQIKIGDPAGANGGANTHGHDAYGHTHTQSHTHTIASIDHYGMSNGGDADNGSPYIDALRYTDHVTHAASTSSADTSVWATTNITFDTVSNEPAYRTAAYIEFQKEIGGGAFLFNLIK